MASVESREIDPKLATISVVDVFALLKESAKVGSTNDVESPQMAELDNDINLFSYLQKLLLIHYSMLI